MDDHTAERGQADMIDLRTETLINLNQATRRLPPSRNGRPVHISTLVRAITRGKNGNKLEALRFGKRWVTSIEAIQRWAEAQTPERIAQPQDRTLATVARDDRNADRRL